MSEEDRAGILKNNCFSTFSLCNGYFFRKRILATFLPPLKKAQLQLHITQKEYAYRNTLRISSI